MTRIGLALKTMFRVLRDAAFAEGVRGLLAPAADDEPKAGPPPEPAPTRSEALTLLATLQREARLVDFVQESLEGYSDAQVGAAVRDLHESCHESLTRMFGLTPLVNDVEGSEVEVPEGFDPMRFRLGGNVTGEPPFRGKLRHPGWRASRCELPRWTGKHEAARIVAPAEVELGE